MTFPLCVPGFYAFVFLLVYVYTYIQCGAPKIAKLVYDSNK